MVSGKVVALHYMSKHIATSVRRRLKHSGAENMMAAFALKITLDLPKEWKPTVLLRFMKTHNVVMEYIVMDNDSSSPAKRRTVVHL
jgi:hypothetical protein